MAGTFEDFLDALLAYESGWDRERYDAGIIVDSQLDTWAGGSVQDFFPDYSSWSELTDEEWETMAYRSMNSYGFVGYQFGEPFLIDLGYYDDDAYYGNGASTNTWDGTWTGKNGVDSLEEFMTQEAQDVAIREAFGFNLETIQDGLAAAGKSLDDYLGTTVTYGSGDSAVTVELTLTGILAGAHLSGAPAIVSLLLNGTLANDEYGTSILQYIDQFGGYDSPSIDELIEYFEERLTGDEGLNNDDNGTADVTADTADVVIDWNWGTNAVISDFNPDTDTIYIGWFTSSQIDVSESDGNVVFTISSNNQTVTLEGVSLSDLTAANFTIMDDTAAEEILSQVSQEDSSDDDTDDTDTGDTDSGDNDSGDTDSGDTDTGDTDTGDTDTGDADDGDTDSGDTDTGQDPDQGREHGTADVTPETATVAILRDPGSDQVITDFDPDTDTIFIGRFNARQIEVTETDGNVVFTIASTHQTVTLEGVSLSDLSADNFTIRNPNAAQEILSLIGQDDSSNDDADDDDSGDTDSGDTDTGDTDTGNTDTGDTGSDDSDTNSGDGTQDTVHMTWNWGAEEVISDFNPSEDVLDFGSLSSRHVEISEVDGDLHIEVLGNGGHTYIIEDVQAEDLSLENLAAASWNDGVLNDQDGVIDQLEVLGNDEIA
ncbi:hypothetical protein [uncultured Roseibium sp.]|uniref:hypothetical protein n=1 Tax=uncultured Roseibium sp. TaxID=1936171 RepID=UPI0032172EAE